MKKQSPTHGQRQTAYNLFRDNRRWKEEDAKDQVWLADWKAHKLPYCSVYIVAPENGWPCKVGISTHAYKRLVGLQTSVWKPLQVAACYWTSTVAEARRLEKEVHKRLSADNVWLHGEWFDMRPDAAKEMVEFVALVEGIEAFSKIDNPEVISCIHGLARSAFNQKNYITDANVGYCPEIGGEALANMANQAIAYGEMVDPALAKQVMLYEEHLEDNRLPTFKGRLP